MSVVGLGAMVASTAAASGCMVRAGAGVSTTPVHVVDEAPPPPREERIEMRPGYVWIRGRWESRGGEWRWRAGHWQRERADHVWEAGHWERRGGRYHWIEGRWVMAGRARVEHRPRHEVEVRDERPQPEVRDHRTRPEPEVRDHRTARPERRITVSIHPRVPPPAPRAEPSRPRRGYVWVGGRYRWEDGAYVWVSGHWERERRGQAWEPGHWERRGDHYVWIEGRWSRR
jgi:hypothetical protein